MKAAVYTTYGPPEVLQVVEVEKPVPKDSEVLIRIVATTVTSRDWRFRKAEPFIARFFTGLLKPKLAILGSDLAGVVEEVGSAVTLFKVGDPIFGTTDHDLGAHAEYKCIAEKGILTIIPDIIGFEEASTVFFGGHTALHFLRKANIKNGQQVLVVGASGSVGSYGVQLAKYYGAEVTAVCSTDNLDLVKSLGADKIIDYSKEDFTKSGKKYDVIFDTVGKNSFSGCIKSLKKNGFYLGTVMMSLPLLVQWLWTLLTTRKKVVGGSAGEHSEDLTILKELIETGHLKPVIDRRYPLEQIADAHRYAEKGHKKGIVVIRVTPNKTKQH
jgi:NADPH:quinone reductase-like Zn-dependent oxidoreductase